MYQIIYVKMNRLRTTLLLCLSLIVLSAGAEQPTARVDKQLEIFSDVMRQLDVNYVDTLNYEKLIGTAIEQMLRQVDPYTIYYSEEDSKKLREMLNLQSLLFLMLTHLPIILHLF